MKKPTQNRYLDDYPNRQRDVSPLSLEEQEREAVRQECETIRNADALRKSGTTRQSSN